MTKTTVPTTKKYYLYSIREIYKIDTISNVTDTKVLLPVSKKHNYFIAELYANRNMGLSEVAREIEKILSNEKSEYIRHISLYEYNKDTNNAVTFY
ncbi:MAG: hypothetical protein WD512_14015 [Candidatus Paceibacterota bacterium]